MLCPKCQISLTVTNRFSSEVNDCSQCHGIWLEQNALEKIVQQMPLVHSSEKSQTNSNVIEENVVLNSQNRKRGSRQFVSGALDIYDDW